MDLFNLENPQSIAILVAVFVVLAVWEMVWKGFALWKAAKNNHLAWYVCIMIFNTIGILPIVYILLNRSKKE
jgi:hypothetical protein